MKLKSITALTPLKQLKEGRTLPLLISGEDSDTNKHEVVLKTFSDREGGKGAAIIELVCALFASKLGLNPPQPFEITIPKAFQEIAPEKVKQKLDKLKGTHYGCLYLPGLSIVVPNRNIQDLKKDEASSIFAYDYFMQNPDRSDTKSNLLESNEGYHLIDHDQALSLVRFPSIFGAVYPWENTAMTNAEFSYMQKHLFRLGLKGQEKRFQSILEPLSSITRSDIDTIINQIPVEWANEVNFLDDLANYLENVSVHSIKTLELSQTFLPK